MNRPKILFFAMLGTACLLTHVDLSDSPLDHKNRPATFEPLEYAFHIGVYGVLTFYGLMIFADPLDNSTDESRIEWAKQIGMIYGIFVIYGILDEVTQPLFNRNFEIPDLLFNMLGSAVAFAAFIVMELLKTIGVKLPE